MVYCLVAGFNNGNHNRKELSYLIFPTDKRLGTWIKFCHRADKKVCIGSGEGGNGKEQQFEDFSPKPTEKLFEW